MEKEKNEHHDKKRLVLFSAIGIVLCAIIAASVIILNNPKVKVAKALKAVNDEIDNKKTMTQRVIGEDDYIKYIAEGYDASMEFSVKSSSDEAFQNLAGSGMKFNELRDIKNKKQSDYVSAQYKGVDLGDFSLYTDNNVAMFRIPVIYDSWIKFDCDNIQNQYNKSILGQYEKLPNQEMSFKLFEDKETKLMNEKELFKKVFKEYKESHKDKLKAINKKIEFKKTDEKKSISVGDKEEECKAYSVFIAKDDLNTLLADFCDYIKNDEQAKIALKGYVKALYASYNSDISQNSLQDNTLVKLTDEYVKDIESIKDDISADDLKMTVYIDSKGRAAGIDIDTILNIKKDSYPLKMSVIYKGAVNISDDIDVSIVINNGTYDRNIDLNLTQEENGTSVKEKVSGKLACAAKEINIDFNIEAEYDTENKQLNGNVSFNDNGEQLGAEFTGNYDYDKTTNSLSVNMDEFKLKSASADQNVELVCNLSYKVSPLTKSIDEPSEEKIEIFKANEYQLVSMIYEVESKLSALKENLQI